MLLHRYNETFSFTDRINEPEEDVIPGPIGPAAGLGTMEQFWEALIIDEILQKIVEHTNQQIEHVCAIMMAKGLLIQSYHEHTDIDEIKAVIGLFYYASARKNSNVDVHDMWDKKHGLTVYRCTMSKNRFSFLCMCIR